MTNPDPAPRLPPPTPPAGGTQHKPGRGAGIVAIAALLAAGLALVACGSSKTPGPPDQGGGQPGGDGGCTAWLSGLLPFGDAGPLLDDAGLACVALLYTDDAGTRTSVSITSLGALPAGVTSFSAIVVLDGGHPPQQDAGSDAGTLLTLASPLVLQASVTVLLSNADAFTLQKPPAGPGGALALRLTEVSDGGPVSAGNVVLTGHGTLDAQVPYLYGPRPDAGTFDAGSAVSVHAEF